MDFAARTAVELSDRWRGFQPWPGAFTALEGKKFIVHHARRGRINFFCSGRRQPGCVYVQNHRLFVACAHQTWLELLEIQLEGKKRLTAAEFLRGTQLGPSARLG